MDPVNSIKNKVFIKLLNFEKFVPTYLCLSPSLGDGQVRKRQTSEIN